jgi:hypothetical protein
MKNIFLKTFICFRGLIHYYKFSFYLLKLIFFKEIQIEKTIKKIQDVGIEAITTSMFIEIIIVTRKLKY